jgi:hypothetical protein
MAHSSFGTGWPNCNRTNIVTLVRKDGLRLPLHRELVPLVAILLDLTEAHGYNVRPDWTWGWACRAIANTRTPSNHSWGTAVDINAPVNPRRARGLPLITDLPKPVIQLWKDHGWRWGGDYSWPDTMHFEFTGSAANARAQEAKLRKYLGKTTPPAPKPKPVPTTAGQRGRLMELQKILRVSADGVVGEKTTAAMRAQMIGWHKDLPGNNNPTLVKWLQRQGVRKGHTLAVDGIVGEQVNHLIVLVLHQRDGVCGPVGYVAAAL